MKEVSRPVPYVDKKKRKPIHIDRAVWERMSTHLRIKMFNVSEIIDKGGDRKDGEHS